MQISKPQKIILAPPPPKSWGRPCDVPPFNGIPRSQIDEHSDNGSDEISENP